MAEASWDGADPTQRLPEKRELTKLQNDIYEFLQKDKPQKALAVAKAVGKTCAKDVNPDLYTMKGWHLLDCSEDKLWSIKAESRASVNKAKMEQPIRTGSTATSPLTEQQNKAKMEQPIRTGSTTTSPLTEQQEEICTLLEKSRPMRAKDIAKKMEKTRKDVNSDLYRLMSMGLLTHNEEKLWRLKSQNDTRCEEREKECEEVGRSPIPSDNNHTDDTTSPNQTETENPNNQLCTGTQCNTDTALIGVSSPDHSYVGGQSLTQVTNGWSAVQSYTQICPPVVKNYTIYIQNSQNFTVGDNMVTGGDSQDPGYITGDSSAMIDGSGAQGAEQPPASEWPNSSQSEDGSMNASDLSLAEEIQERPPRTSSPADTNPSRQCLNLSTICDGIEKLNLEQQDDHLS
ncbi:Z-DNA-binding protein 1 isoform X3 [Rana temporaria]|uniref:Z-DNA-binding protein 1 isoform X3 n=1 Tax=Rana temporaria TaxID=8407 RepID=UPI001AAD3F1D|nr:Z-DNA-binding protein 1 isoform X3 [Rana temporaria]